jgi:hypothetical protein
MKWRIDFGDRPWHRWFAWYPVRVGDAMIWLEYVERKTENFHGYICHRYRVSVKEQP